MREETLVKELGDDVAAKAADKRILGASITQRVSDADIFQVDRDGDATMSLSGGVEKRSKVRRSEMALLSNEKVTAMRVGKHRTSQEGATEIRLLGKRNWKKRERKKMEGLKAYDLWGGQTMNAKIERKKAKNEVKRDAKAVLEPASGDSVNPITAAHQERMHEAAKMILDDERRNERWKEDVAPGVDHSGDLSANALDPKDSDASMSDEEESDVIKPVTGERKTRSQRNKERRKRVSKFERLESMRKKRKKAQYKNLAALVQEVEEREERKESKTRKTKEADPSAPVHSRLAGAKVPSEARGGHVSLSEDLALTLREVAPPVKNTLLSERFLSLQRRGLIIPAAATRKHARQAKREALEEERKRGIRKIRPGRGSRSGLSFFERRLR